MNAKIGETWRTKLEGSKTANQLGAGVTATTSVPKRLLLPCFAPRPCKGSNFRAPDMIEK
jgi:hypothetical protein